MSGPGPVRAQATWTFGLLVVLLLVGSGRLALHAWMGRPVPGEVPLIRPAVLPPGVRADAPPAPFLLIIIDGLRESAAWDEGENAPMPWLRAFAEEGAWGIGVAGEPTLTAPCVRALISGRRPDLITGFRNFNAHESPGTLMELLRRGGATTAHGGDAAAFQFARRWYPKDAVLQFPDQGPTDQGQTDARTEPFVLARVADGATAISVHFTFPDHAGHKHGALGADYAAACTVIDGRLQRIVEAFRARHQSALVLIAADHGVSALGTHGGGEAEAKRAPFALVGPRVAKGRVVLDQCALAPTVAALLGLPQPPLADAPPARDLMDLPPEVEEAALRAYVEARVAVARSVGVDVDGVERRRAALSAAEVHGDPAAWEALAARAGAMVTPTRRSAEWLTLLMAFLGTLALLRVARHVLAGGDLHPVLLGGAALALAWIFDALPGLTDRPGAVALVIALPVGAAFWQARRAVPRGDRAVAAWLLVMALVAGVGLTLQEAFGVGDDPAAAAGRLGWALLAGAVVLGLAVRVPQGLRSLHAGARAAPLGAVAIVGGIFGFLLTLRPFVDPFLRTETWVAVLGVALLVSAWRRLGPVARGAVGVGVALLVGAQVGDALSGARWPEAFAPRDGRWLGISLLLLAAVPVVGPRVSWRGMARGPLALALLTLVLAHAGRLVPEATWIDALGATGLELFTQCVNVLGLAALVWGGWRTRGAPRLLFLLVAGAALARRLASSDAEMAGYAALVLGCAWAARLPLSTRRGAWVGLGLAFVLLRTAVFHAMGFTESFSTLDVGQAFQGLAGGDAEALDPDAAPVVTHQVVLAGLQVALRMALPWIPFLAVLGYVAGRAGPGRSAVRGVLLGVAVAFLARGAAIVMALPAWWRQSWWIAEAWTIHAYAAADVILLFSMALLCGGFARQADVSDRAPRMAS